jgi:hypothetical protein
VVEGGGLENRFTSDRDGGSNPSPSATLRMLCAPGGLFRLFEKRLPLRPLLVR